MNGHPSTEMSEPGGADGGADEVSVLVVDDETAVAELYAEQLEDACDVETAYGGEQALDQVDEGTDVVLLDRRMPDLSGDEVLAALRRRNLDVRVAMVTAVEPDVDVVDMPFDDYLVKPVAGDELRATVERLRTLAEYEQLRLELSSKRVKRNVLAAEHREDELADSESFRALQARIAELEATLAAIETELDEAHLRAARAA